MVHYVLGSSDASGGSSGHPVPSEAYLLGYCSHPVPREAYL